MSSKKINKKFVLSDSSVNEYGFRLLSSGYQLHEFDKNPIGYYMHRRDDGVVVKWCDLKLEDDQVTAYPEINLVNERGQQTADEVENGFLNAASMGHIVVLDYSIDPELMLPGQTGPTITKWYNKECSLVDIPGNCHALTELYDADDNAINLADMKMPFENARLIKMGPLAAALQLPVNTTMEEVVLAIELLSARNDTLQQERAALAAANDMLKTELHNLQTSFLQRQIEELLDGALEERRITVAYKKLVLSLKPTDVNMVKELLAPIKKYQSITDAIEAGDNHDAQKVHALMSQSWDELDKAGKLKEIKESYPELYAEKFREQFGRK